MTREDRRGGGTASGEEFPATTEHDIGARGRVVIEVAADDIRVRGVDGTVARILSPRGGRNLAVQPAPGELTIRGRGAVGSFGFLGLRLGGFGFGVGIDGTVEVEVPRDALLDISTASGDMVVRDVLRGVRARTASGNISLRNVGGDLVYQSASGDLEIETAAPISLRAETMSGDVDVDAPRVESTDVRTVSGDIEMATNFAPGTAHSIETTSGDVELSVGGGATIEARTVSGQVDVTHPERRGGVGRNDPVVIGDGAATISVRTLSGDIEIRRGRAAPTGMAPVPARPPMPAMPPVPPVPPVPAVPSLAAAPANPALLPEPAGPLEAPPGVELPGPPALAGLPAGQLAAALPAGTEPPAIVPAEPAEPAEPIEPAGPAVTPGRAPREDPTLALLEALARGDIDVDEAERRIVAAGLSDGGQSDV
jgi:hypothetical protein